MYLVGTVYYWTAIRFGRLRQIVRSSVADIDSQLCSGEYAQKSANVWKVGALRVSSVP